MMNDLTFDDLVEITLHSPDDFLKIKETLTRIGISSKKTKTLYQSCHIFHKRGRYAIAHFKEMFAIDGKESTIDETDIARRNTIIRLLSDWGLLVIVDERKIAEPVLPLSQLKILKYGEKGDWTLSPKFTIGIKHD